MSILRRPLLVIIVLAGLLVLSVAAAIGLVSRYIPSVHQVNSGRPTAASVPTGKSTVPEWKPQVKYQQGTMVRYKSVIYESLHAHTSQPDWPPNITSMLWQEVSVTGPVAWQANNFQYNQGDEVSYNGNTYKAIRAHTSQASANPANTPALWQLLNTPRFEDAPCPMDLTGPYLSMKYVEGQNIHCGYLIVKENRQVQDSSEIRLAVAIVKSSSPHPAPDPLLMLQGGPGGALLQDFDFFASGGGIRSQAGNRDIILLDQRGTGFSRPSLICTEEFAYHDATTEQPDYDQKLFADVLRQCHQRLLDEHIDISAYNTYNDANDIHDLITTLKLQQVNIYGVSYGTRVSLEVMRSFPQHVRSIILDSTVPAELNFFEDVPHDYARVFQVLFQGCAADTTCARKYPNLESRFYTFVAAANQHPVTMTLVNPQTGKVYPKAVMRGYDIFLGLWQMFYVTHWIPSLPAIMDEIINGQYNHFAAAYSLLAFDTSVNTAVYESTVCSSEERRTTRANISKIAQELNPAVRTLVIDDTAKYAFDQCNIWNVPTVVPSEWQPVASSIPTLVMEGEYDPITPPTSGNEAAAHLPNSFVTLFPATGHGVYLSGQQCPVQVEQSFIDQPQQQPNTACIQSMSEPTFK
ncbi:MAG: alpha/beta fold hydrolase [Chloroflexi bacterium]|nr:alpha/beta fold hydrolase [Chloroflexota bacterium]